MDSQALDLVDSFYRVDSVVFGGGHVVLPLIQAEVVPDWVSRENFIAGYGAAQAVPGPPFTFAAYLGGGHRSRSERVAGRDDRTGRDLHALFLLVAGTLPVWDVLRRRGAFQSALRGINAAVVGIVAAALYTPVWTSAIFEPNYFGLALAAFGLLQMWRLPAWLVVILAAAGGQALAALWPARLDRTGRFPCQ